jgi:acyl carrier protein
MNASPETIEGVRSVLARTLQLGSRAATLERSTALLGNLPELDSMAVVHVLTGLEDHFAISIDDDEISADTFASFGGLADFVEQKLTV